MKIIKYLLIIVVALIAVFFLIGQFSSGAQYESQVTVDAPAHQAWNMLIDESNMSKWLPGYQRAELVSGTANTVGAVSDIYFIENGNETVIRETITAVIPNQRMAMDFSIPDMMDMKYDMQFQEQNGKTAITSRTTVSGVGAFGRSMTAIMKGAMSAQEDENLANLKKLIEEGS